MGLKNCRNVWYDAEKKVAVTFVDVTDAAQELARAHLCGPTAAHYLAKGLAAVALLLALMPWVNVNSSLVSAGSVANGVAKGVSSLTGANTGDWSFKSGYSPMQFVDLGNTVSNYEGAASTLKSVLGSSKYSSDQNTSNTIYLTFGLWLLCFGVTVAGGIATFFSRKRNPVALAFGLSLLTLFSFSYVIMYFSFGSFVSDKLPLFAYLCGLVAAAGTICSFTAFWQRN